MGVTTAMLSGLSGSEVRAEVPSGYRGKTSLSEGVVMLGVWVGGERVANRSVHEMNRTEPLASSNRGIALKLGISSSKPEVAGQKNVTKGKGRCIKRERFQVVLSTYIVTSRGLLDQPRVLVRSMREWSHPRHCVTTVI